LNVFYQPRLSEGITFLDNEEAHHAKVLRLSVGDKILVTDGKGLITHSTIESIEKQLANFSIQERTTYNPPFTVHLFVAPTKNADRIEWLVEKATEIGVTSITMMQCHRSERSRINLDRLNKLALSAMKQSQRPWLPEIKDLTPLADIVKMKFDQNFIAYVDHSNPDKLKDLAEAGKSYGLLIGPEGDFTSEEIKTALDNRWKKVSLGPTRFRTETAALAGVLTLVLVNS
jgi:16S rRNA (uracil1498-N3)-methyltransferase